MKKRILAVLLCLCIGTMFFSTMAFSAFAAGSPNWSEDASRDTAWTDGAISTPEQLAQFAYLVNTGTYKGKNDVWLTQDINLAGREWTPIGEYQGAADGYHQDSKRFFRGIFDGNGYAVKNMQLSSFLGETKDLCITGLFGSTKATIRNLTVTGTAATQNASARIYMGAIAGISSGAISNCTSRLSMNITTTGVSYIGGIVGSNTGKVTRCTNEADITIHSKNTNVGGIAAASQGGEIDRCFNKGNLAGEAVYTGGIVAYVFGVPSTVTNCINHGAVSIAAAVSYSSIGGIAGYYNGTGMSNCYNTGVIQPAGGGLIGELDKKALNTPNNINYDNLYYSAEGSALGARKLGGEIVTEKNDVGIRKTEKEMKQESFATALNGSGNAFIAQEDGFPKIVPLTVNVVIDVTPKDATVSLSQSENGAAIAPETDGSYILLPGDYFIKASAANYQINSFIHTVSYDRATQTVTVALEPLPADYTKVDEAIARANALNKADYRDFSAVDAAIAAVERGKNITEQAAVDAMAKAIENALDALERKPVVPNIPATGETGMIQLWFALLLISGAGAAGPILFTRKKIKAE